MQRSRYQLIGAVACLFVSRLVFGMAYPDSADILRLYGEASQLSGHVSFDANPRWLVAEGEGTAVWRIEIPRTAEYRVWVVYATRDPGAGYDLSVGSRSYSGVLKTQPGIFPDPSQNFERVQLVSSTHLDRGSQAVRIHFNSDSAQVYLRSLEVQLIEPHPEQLEAKILRSRADTGWLANSGYGVMFHWTSQSQPPHGPAKSYAQAVADFDVPKFAAMVQETGAAYVLFTVNHADPHCPAPIVAWERAHPGWTTRRDLIGEIADALAKRHIRLMLYIASHTLGGLNESTAAQYMQIHKDVLTELGHRYGNRVSGYWFDGWYQTREAYPDISAESLLPFARAGNPYRLVAYNFWIYPVETQWQDYWAGEVAGIVEPAAARILESGPGAGLQNHNLLILDAPWVHSTPDAGMEPPNFTNHDLSEYVRAMRAHGGAVTLNVGIFQDGTIGEATRQQLIALRKAIEPARRSGSR